MLNNASVMDRSDAPATAREGPLPRASDQGGQLCAIVDLHGISLKLLRNTLIWDVRKRRAVTVAYLFGQHTSDSQHVPRCCQCATIRQALKDLAIHCVPPEGNRCQHNIGPTRGEHVQDSLSGTVHELSLPIVFIHRTASPKDESSSSNCVAEFRSHLERFGVRELHRPEMGDRGGA